VYTCGDVKSKQSKEILALFYHGGLRRVYAAEFAAFGH
jgi:hypothetical protein